VRFEVADVLSLPYENGSFDAVIEKGVFDVFCSAAKSQWEHPPEVAAKMTVALAETKRVLRQRGTLFSVTFAQPMFRRLYFQGIITLAQ